MTPSVYEILFRLFFFLDHGACILLGYEYILAGQTYTNGNFSHHNERDFLIVTVWTFFYMYVIAHIYPSNPFQSSRSDNCGNNHSCDYKSPHYTCQNPLFHLRGTAPSRFLFFETVLSICEVLKGCVRGCGRGGELTL